LAALPFVVNKAYAELIYNRTSSPRLSKVLRKCDDKPEATSELDAPAEAANPAPAPVAAPPPTATAGPAASIEDVSIRAIDILAVIVSEAEEATQ